MAPVPVAVTDPAAMVVMVVSIRMMVISMPMVVMPMVVMSVAVMVMPMLNFLQHGSAALIRQRVHGGADRSSLSGHCQQPERHRTTEDGKNMFACHHRLPLTQVVATRQLGG